MIELERKYNALLTKAAAHDGASLAAMRLCFELLALADAIDRDCAIRLGAHGLSEGKFVLLFLLEDSEEGLSPFELADRAGVTRGTVTGLLDGLERTGLVRRLSHVEDRRKLVVRLTDEGKRLAKTLTAEHSRWIASLFSDFTEEERSVLSRLLSRAFAHTDVGAEARGKEGT